MAPPVNDLQHLPIDRTVVLIGMMGAGKTAVGRRLAKALGWPFRDADEAIEAAAGTTISNIFAEIGEAAFREKERQVIARLLGEERQVLALGGGAFVDPATRAMVRAKALSVWLRADLDALVRRTGRPGKRPLLAQGDPRARLAELLEQRTPIYAEADLVVDSGNAPLAAVVDRVLEALAARANGAPPVSGDQRLAVELGARSYEFVVGSGLLGRAGPALAKVLRRPDVVIVTDANLVATPHLGVLERALQAAGIARRCIVLPPGEATKSMTQLAELLDRLLDLGVDRATTMVAFGGGVLGDLAGFAAAVLLRGLDYVQVPTTLLAQVDSAVGGKTGINVRHGKNLVGAFYQPRLVLADTAVLASLPSRELRAGYAEVVKYGLIDRPDFFGWLEAHGRELLAGDPAAQQHAVLESCRAKASVVAADEREGGVRALLNLGHTFAHALETACGYGDELRHGEAVALGMVLAFDLSVRLGLCPAADAERVRTHLATVGLPTTLGDVRPEGFAAETLLAAMGHDKKAEAGRPRFVLTRGIGRAFAGAEVAPAELEALLAAAA